MGIVNLGSKALNVGDSPASFDTIPFDATQAYLIAANMAPAQPGSIFSFVRIRPFIQVTGLPGFFAPGVHDLPIVDGFSTFYFAASPLFGGSGNVTFVAERLLEDDKFFDSGGLQMSLVYDDAVSVPTWRG